VDRIINDRRASTDSSDARQTGERPENHAASRYLSAKAPAERGLAVLLLVLLLPLLALAVVVVFVASPGPVIYRQRRVGKHGKVFTLYKFRSMPLDAESDSGPVWSPPGDERIGALGRCLRWSHIDELPQLVNVARGEMSLIGPRPERPVFVAQLQGEIDGYRNRHAVLPGMTGLAQIALPADTSLDCVRHKIALDRAYIRSACFTLDARIVLHTALLMLGVRRAVGGKFSPGLRAFNIRQEDRQVLQARAAETATRATWGELCRSGRNSLPVVSHLLGAFAASGGRSEGKRF